MNPIFVYDCGPIDWWVGWATEKEFLAQLAALQFGEEATSAYHHRRHAGLVLARKAGWEGDMREGPFVAGLPSEPGTFEYLIAWKQDNNGQTFVVSPVRLPWLEDASA
jgi:hypothetical protein